VLKGFNYRMEGIQGAILGVKLRYLETWTEARRARARDYDALLTDTETVRAPTQLAGRRHVYHIYAVRSADRDGLQRLLQADGVQTGLHYPIPVHLQEAHADLGYHAGDFPESEAAAREVLSLPIFPEMTSSQVEQVVRALGRVANVA
jgi:dTDP-4-amino-4,6-dideoxygalactose transaminase